MHKFKNVMQKKLFKKPTKPAEICDIIKILKIVKIQVLTAFLERFLGWLKNLILTPLWAQICKSFANVTFPNVYKIEPKGSTHFQTWA